MSEALLDQQTNNQPDDQEKVDSPLQRFLKINEDRNARVQSSLSQRKQSFLDALPLLFHSNDKELPGYISDKTPFGIASYAPSGQTLYEARRIAKNSKIGKKAPRKFDLLGLYFMGSPGTIAYNGQSDFDIWLFIDPDLEEDRLSELHQKTDLIEEWAAKTDIEVHFFIINPDKFRSGEMLPLSSESSGSSQHGLLLDEFYRSSILIAGLPLTWWMVPPEFETQYDAYLYSQRHVESPDSIDLEQCINLGPLTEVSPEEFFGAAVWQLTKSIQSPYKSVLKLLLMEVYAFDEAGISLISHRFKKSVYAGTTNASSLDPWLLMYEQVEEYLLDQNDSLRLNILRRSFYLKINEKLSQNSMSRFGDWKQKLIINLIKKWEWDEDQVLELDSRENWKLETVTEERANLVNALTKSFRVLSKFAKQQSSNPNITKLDLQVLNRRLFSAFERKAGKIDIINRGISPDIRESTVSLHYLKPSPEPAWGLSQEESLPPSSWVLYRGIVTNDDLGDSTHLKRTSSLLEMIAWCYFNEVLDLKSKIMLYLPADKNIKQQEIKTILDAFHKQFPLDQADINDQALSQPVQLTSGAIFVNTGLEPKEDPALNNTLLSSQRSNALSYGGQHENLTQTFDMVFKTSWGETFIKHYSGKDGLSDCITEYMTWAPPSRKLAPAVLNVYCYSPGYGAQIRKTLSEIFNGIVENFYTKKGSSEGRYILEVKDGYQTIEIRNDVITHKFISNKNELMGYLGRPNEYFIPQYFGPYACTETLLPSIYATNKPDEVQIFFHLNKNEAKVYVLDEKGSLFTQTNSFVDKHSLFGHYKLFADTIIDRILHDNLSNLLQDGERTSKLYLVEKERDSYYVIKPVSLMADRSNNFLSLQVLCDRDENNSEQYTIYCQNKEFSSLDYGDKLFNEVARQIMNFRSSRQTYSAYITDIDLSQSMLHENDKNKFQSNQFFRYKKHIESKLTNALIKSKLTNALKEL